MRRRIPERLHGAAALLWLLLLMFGPPVALGHFVGWPLPTGVPNLDQLSAAARGGVDDLVVVKALAVVAWWIWVQLALAATVEVAAMFRGRAARRAPVLPVIQTAVARLVASAALVLSTMGTPRLVQVPISHVAAVAAQPAVVIGASPFPRIEPDAAPARLAEAGASYVVKRNDSWWEIAERLMGNGRRWSDLRAANAGRTMVDGTVIDATTRTIRPGWELAVPASPAGSTEARGDVATEDATVRRGDNLWTIAEDHLERLEGSAPNDAHVQEHWRKVIELNRSRLADPADPGRIFTGQVIRLPPVPTAPSADLVAGPGAVEEARPTNTTGRLAVSDIGPTPTPPVSPPPAAPAQGPASGPARSDHSARRVATSDSSRHADSSGKLLGTAGTMIAVGVSAAVVRRRRRRQLDLPAGVAAPFPPPHLGGVRAELAAGADVDRATRLHRAMRDIAASLSERGCSARPRLVQVAGKHVEALLSEAVMPPPKGWQAEASGAAWVLNGEPADRGDDEPAPMPALVTIGGDDSDGEIYLDLEAEGVVALCGDEDVVADVARSWILELATSPLASGASIIVAGKALVSLVPSSSRVRGVRDWGEVAAEVRAWSEQSATLTADKGWPTPPTGRLGECSSDALAPLIVFCEPSDDDTLCALCELISDRPVSVTVVIVGGRMEGATTVEVAGGELRVPVLGLTCSAQAVSAPAAEQVEELLDDVSRLPAQLSFVPPTPSADSPATPNRTSVAHSGEDPEIVVRVLGDIDVEGASRRLKPKQVAVLTYIALHAPVASERVEDALWIAETASRRKRLANTVSECRSALGATHLPLASDGRYRIGPGVTTDLEMFERRISAASDQDDDAAIAALRDALDLVRGPVFTYRNADRGSYVWVDVENWISTWELRVSDAAEDLAQRCLDLDDPDGAAWAAKRGLAVSPTHSRLTKWLIKAHFAKGETNAARQVFESHQSALQSLDLDDVDPDLIDYYYDARRPRGTLAG